VFATVRAAEHLDQLPAGAIGQIVDVRDEQSVHALAEEVTRALGDRRFAGVVNNAAVSQMSPLVEQPLDEVRDVFETNVFGTLAVTSALAPLLRRDKGTVVTIGSRASRFPALLNGAYAASKAAVDSLTTALRLELKPFDVHVVSVVPGRTESALKVKARQQLVAAEHTWGQHEIYGRWRTNLLARQQAATAVSADQAAEVIVEALAATNPRNRYIIGAGERARFYGNSELVHAARQKARELRRG